MIAVCPRCDKPMAAFIHGEVELDVCGDCSGMWLDEGEFAELADAAAEPDLPTDALLAELKVPGRKPKGRARLCPRCSRGMEEVELPAMAQQPATHLDRCPVGHGLFFDPGELRQVLMRHHSPDSPLSLHLADFFGPDSLDSGDRAPDSRSHSNSTEAPAP